MRTAFRHVNRLAIGPGFNGFNVPATMNGSTTAINSMTRIAVNSSGLFVSVGTDWPNSFALYATSANGSTWTTPALMNGTTTGVNAGFSGIAVNSSGLFVAVGSKIGGSVNPVYATSANGSTWTSPAIMSGINLGIATGIAVNSSGLFVAIGNGSSGSAWWSTSSNGSTWTTPAAFGAGGSNFLPLGIAVNSAGRFVVVGTGGSNAPYFSTSTDGSTWTTPAAISGSIQVTQIKVAVNSAGLFVAVGGDTLRAAFYTTSADGTTWTAQALMNGVVTQADIVGIAVNSAGLFVAVGVYTNKPAYAYSLNGTQWSTPVVVSGAGDGQLSGVTATSSNSFVAVGIDGNTYPIYATSK